MSPPRSEENGEDDRRKHTEIREELQAVSSMTTLPLLPHHLSNSNHFRKYLEMVTSPIFPGQSEGQFPSEL